jgi:hypothetical protein
MAFKEGGRHAVRRSREPTATQMRAIPKVIFMIVPPLLQLPSVADDT